MKWQKKVRAGIAVGGLAFAVALFFFIGERESVVPPPAPARVDPKAIIESSDAIFRQVRGIEQDYEVKAQRQLMYDDGSSKLIRPEIAVRGREGRDFVMTGDEAIAGDKHRDVTVSGAVSLAASDGFELHTDRATFSESDGIVRAPGALTFRRGGMSGDGVGMTYDKNTDVLIIADQSHVTLADASGSTIMEFTGGSATLARRDNYLLIERGVHALRGEQVIDTDRATARLTESDEQITFIELRGNSRVAGGSDAFDAMSARDIDLDYTDDGTVLEGVVLNGSGAIALTGQKGAAGRQLAGESLNIALASDGTATAVTGRGNVRMDLPAAKGTPTRRVSAQLLDAMGEPGRGLTSARFTDDVEFREEAQGPKGVARVARSRSLRAALVDNDVSDALFSGAVTFSEQGLQAGAAEARYAPVAGTLALKGTDQGGGPRVADEQVEIKADAINVRLEGRHMTATGAPVRTTLRPKGKGDARMPGLLEQGQPATADANALEYDGDTGHAVYAGTAKLLQGETAVYADRLVIDRAVGDLVATGTPTTAARSHLSMDNGTSIGRAAEIRYEDAKRQVTYLGAIAPPAAPSKPGGEASAAGGRRPIAVAGPAAPTAQLSSPEGDVRSDLIVVSLAKSDNKVEQLEATGHVALKLDTRAAAGAHMIYHAADGRYVMSGLAGELVTVVENCRETRGKTLTFFKSTDRIIVDGNQEIRTQTKSGGGPCPGAAVK